MFLAVVFVMFLSSFVVDGKPPYSTSAQSCPALGVMSKSEFAALNEGIDKQHTYGGYRGSLTIDGTPNRLVMCPPAFPRMWLSFKSLDNPSFNKATTANGRITCKNGNWSTVISYSPNAASINISELYGVNTLRLCCST